MPDCIVHTTLFAVNLSVQVLTILINNKKGKNVAEKPRDAAHSVQKCSDAQKAIKVGLLLSTCK